MDDEDKLPSRPKLLRGFAKLSPERREEIASSGGIAAQRRGTAHKFSREEAVSAGRLGGKKAHANARAKKILATAALVALAFLFLLACRW